MSRWIPLAALTLVLSVGGMALAAAVNVSLEPTGVEPAAEGRAILNYASGADKTIVQVNCRGLESGATYEVWMTFPGDHLVGSFTTRPNGSGSLNAHMGGDHTGHLPLEVRDADGVPVLEGD